jgi:rRNA-processing protein EBP2
MVQEVKQRERTNNVPGLKQKLDEFKLDKMPWIERLDLINKPAPLAPELAYQEDQHQKSREKAIKHNKQGEKKKAGSTGK